MKLLLYISLLYSALFLSSCATIIGGSNYNAHVIVMDKPNAKISYKGEYRGNGSTTIKVKRSEANKFSFTVKEEGCEAQTYMYKSRAFRGGALVGTILVWTGTINGILIPWGVFVDLATGALWKPNVMERGISKEDYKSFRYQVNYNNCNPSNPFIPTQIIDVVYLKNGSIIKGLIIEQIMGVQIKLQTKDGNLFVFKSEEIEKLTREPSK